MTRKLGSILIATLALAACQSIAPAAPQAKLNVVAAETFLADIAQNVAGDRVPIAALMPIGVDPHGFEPTPIDVAKVADSNLLIINGAGFEGFLAELLQNAGGQRTIIEAATGLASRQPSRTEIVADTIDPHFWLDPNHVIKYAENIRDGLSQADPDGAAIYAANADRYIQQLQALDQTIRDQVAAIPAARRLIVTNHESFGYFADRYGFKIIGTIVPSVSAGSAPSAQQLAQLIDHIKATGASAIFLETGTNPQLAQQVANETGLKVVTGLYSHSITDASGPAPTYLDMMRANVTAIAAALK